MRLALRHTVRIMEQAAFDPFRGGRLGGLTDEIVADDAACDAWIRANSHSAYHLCATCKMGKVVDATGRVFGVDNLRVIDASVFPSLTSGNLNAPTIMLAEKMADAVLGLKLPPMAVEWVQPTHKVPAV